MTTLKVSRGMGNHLLCVRYTKSGANTENAVHRIKMPPFMIVHHMKNIVSVNIHDVLFLFFCIQRWRSVVARFTNSLIKISKFQNSKGVKGSNL